MPNSEYADRIVCPPYDVIESDEARKTASGNRYSFLHVTKAEIDLSPDVDIYDDTVYRKAAENLAGFRADGILVGEKTPSYYVYRAIAGDHIQTGIACGVSVDEYEGQRIRRHEQTREEKVDDRVRHSLAIDGHAEPVFLVHRASPAIAELVSGMADERPLYNIRDDNGVEHILWRAKDASSIMEALGKLDALYIADGHHRSAAAGRVRDIKRGRNPNHNGEELYNFFPAVLFPHNEVRVFEYGWTGDSASRPSAKVTISEIMDLADKSGIMPPKNTWFAPKLVSGLFVYPF